MPEFMASQSSSSPDGASSPPPSKDINSGSLSSGTPETPDGQSTPPGSESPPSPSQQSSPSPPTEKQSPPPSSPPPTPAASPPPASPPPTTPSPSPSPPPPSSNPTPANGGSSPAPPAANLSPPPPNTTPVTPSPPGVFSPPPPRSVPGAPGRPLPTPSQPLGSPTTPPLATKTPPSSGSSPSNNSGLIAGAALTGVVLLAVVAICLVCSKKKKKQPYYMDPGRPPKGNDYYRGGPPNWNSPGPMDHVVKLPSPATGWGPPPNQSGEFNSGMSGGNNHPPLSPGFGGFNQSQFGYEQLAAATSGFSQANLLGQGGFGYVHKGVLPDGRIVAVKSLKSGSGQGEREFQAEVEIISRVHHRHLVSLVGYCIAESQRMLVYEFVPNQTLEFHLHGKGQPVMGWEIRLRIALGSAKGLAYLHEDCHPRIIHRDIKAANILLDERFEAMVADFGLAKLSSDNYTHVSTRVMGTFGYLAPEYASSGKLSDKSDVFSFGVMLLELITGRRPVDPNDKYMEDSLVDWARPIMTKALEDGDYREIADPRLEGNYPVHEMARMVGCASASIRHSARRRPKMSQIVRALEGDSSLDDLSDGPKQLQGGGSGDTQVYDTGMYNADMSKFRKMVMNTQEFNSSEFEGTNEFASPSSSDSRGYGSSGPQIQKPSHH